MLEPSDHRIDILEESLKRDSAEINTKLDRILSHLEHQLPIQQRLDKHITFIESVYSSLRGTISYLSWFGKGKEPLSIV